MSKVKILVIDDEEAIINLVTSYLRPEGYEIYTAADGVSGLQVFRAFNPDLILLDIMLPGMDGIELLSKIRRESDTYVIMLTAKSEEIDKIVGLSIGADDYVTKPFSPRELVARIKAAVRRMGNGGGSPDVSVLVFKHIRIDTGRRKVWVGDQLIELTTTEFDLMKSLAEHRGLVLSREQLLEDVWGHEYFGELRVVDVHIGHIRKKIGDEYITTVRGVGYRFEDEVG
ncbi:MAG: response regulator transcription factor [Anaerolineales bacterium]|nr:response regulator transcription factor [Anaerolineales bacterium]